MFVLSYIRPDRTATVMNPVVHPVHAAIAAAHILKAAPYLTGMRDDARQFALSLAREPLGTELTHTPSGVTFRIDDADTPPNVCPCCSALVRPGDHAEAGMEDAYCLGCFTWQRDVPQCLPANTAHPEGYTPTGQ